MPIRPSTKYAGVKYLFLIGMSHQLVETVSGLVHAIFSQCIFGS